MAELGRDGSRLTAEARWAELRQAARALVRQPLLHSGSASEEDLAVVRRHEQELKRWFRQTLGYSLVVGRDYARLHKVALRPLDIDHPARRLTEREFDRHRYALLCLALAALDGTGGQILISELAEAVTAQAAVAEVALPSFDRHASRQAFVDVVRWLTLHGVLARIDGSEEDYVRTGTDDVLYDVDPRLASQLLLSGFRPDVDLGAEPAGDYPPTAEGANARTRHRLYRMLVEDAALYVADLTDAERDYLIFQRSAIRRELADWLGLRLEVRAEGALAFDPENELSDRRFPGASAVAHVALLLGCAMALPRGEEGADPEAPFTRAEVDELLTDLLESYGRYWGRLAQDEEVGDIASHALNCLADFKLARFVDGGVLIQPAMARFNYAVSTGDQRDR
jgi:uncharacterized protein (TIGR02678 family)